MNTVYEPVIGLEIHLQTKTKTKMFCSCSADYFGKDPNTHICPVCLGLPGALPVPNKIAFEKTILLSLATSCEITSLTKFDRKNYFYPDLPNGYQISQFDLPIGHDGFLEIDVHGDSQRIRLIRIHQEEDTGKSLIQDGVRYLDFNKAGIPLIEIVTYPDFKDGNESQIFAKELRRIVRYLDISDADMEEGSMRVEVNISMRPENTIGMPDYKVEIKNIGSITAVGKAIDYEIKRQSDALNDGEKLTQETRRWDEDNNVTIFQRTKETSSDYRYFPEPNIPPIEINDDWKTALSVNLEELPIERKHRYEKDFDIDGQIAYTLTEQKILADWFEHAVESIKEESKKHSLIQNPDRNYPKDVANWLISDIMGYLKANHLSIADIKLHPSHLAQIVLLVGENKISGTVAKQILYNVFESGDEPVEIVKSQGLEQIHDTSALGPIIDQVIANHESVVEEYKEGKENAIKFLLGKVMKESKGKANPQVALDMLHKKLD